MPSSDKYTDPKLRDEIKEEIQNSDKGGQPGQWSARKAQMMASEYKKRGGSYNTSPDSKDDSQKNLTKWGEEEWQTKEGSGNPKQEDGTEKRYLPKKAWENMSEEEKKETDEKKQKESKDGKQFVGNTAKAKDERKKASESKEEDEEQEEQEDGGEEQEDGGEEQEDGGEEQEDGGEEQEAEKEKGEKSQGSKGGQAKSSQTNGNGKKSNGKQAESKKTNDNDKQADEAPSSPRRSQRKRSTSASGNEETKSPSKKSKDTDDSAQTKSDQDDSNKKQKTTHGSKHDTSDPPNNSKPASSSRLPEKGQEVVWKAMPGWVSGKVLEILTSNKTVEGKSIKASKDDPRISLRSNGPSGKVAVHKPAAVYF